MECSSPIRHGPPHDPCFFYRKRGQYPTPAAQSKSPRRHDPIASRGTWLIPPASDGIRFSPPPATFEWLSGDAYQGPVVVRLDPEENVPLPRRLDVVAPLLPKGAAPGAKAEPLYRFISVATTSSGEIVLLNSVGEVLVLTSDGRLRPLARLPSGHYHRTHMTAAPDGSVFVSSGFQIRQIFRISREGVTVIASGLGDPEGIAVDDAGDLFVAENALHRVIRISPVFTPPRAWPR